jgi:4-amino-4-deoxy-L-arabinose transferase-like glycosyltransferase
MTTLPQPLLTPVRRWIDAWFDSAHAVPTLLGLFVAAWTAFQVISFASVDPHPDVLEVYAWGRHPSAGYYKHPPLGGLMAGAWFAVFPAADWSAHLLAMANAALSLFVVDLIARRYLANDKRLLVLILLLLTPFYQFHAVRFGTNQVLLLTWPIAVYCFLRAVESRGVLWGVAAGAAAALAMLGKYFSIYLVAGLVLAALLHPDRLRYLRSASPWVSIAAGFAMLAPHILWLRETGFQPFTYALAIHGAPTRLAAAAHVPGYLIGALAYILLPFAVFAWATRPRPADVATALWPRDPNRRLLATLLWAPLLLPAVTAPLLKGELTSLWTMQGWFLLPILLLMPERIELRRDAAVTVAGGVSVLTLVLLLASPAIAWLKHQQGTHEERAYYSPVAQDLMRHWREAAGVHRLAIVLGEINFAAAATLYVPNHPDSVPGFNLSLSPWVTPERMAREGFAVICRDETCADQALRLAVGHPRVRHVEIEAVRTFLGVPTPPARFILVLAPPRN